MMYFVVNKNGKTYEVELECRVVNNSGSWVSTNAEEFITEEMLDKFREIVELEEDTDPKTEARN